jgi:hypothetical protein
VLTSRNPRDATTSDVVPGASIIDPHLYSALLSSDAPAVPILPLLDNSNSERF